MKPIFKKISIALSAIFMGLGMATLIASPAQAAACTFSKSSITFSPPSYSVGNEIFANETGNWEFSVSGTGSFSGQYESWSPSWKPTSSGTKSVSYSRTFSWTNASGSTCSSTVSWTTSKQVLASVKPTFFMTPSGRTEIEFMKDTTVTITASRATSGGVTIPVEGTVSTLRFVNRYSPASFRMSNNEAKTKMESRYENFKVYSFWWKNEGALKGYQVIGENLVTEFRFIPKYPTRIQPLIITQSQFANEWKYYKAAPPDPVADTGSYHQSGTKNLITGHNKNAIGAQYTEWKYRGIDNLAANKIPELTKIKYLDRWDGLGPNTPTDTADRNIWYVLARTIEPEHNQYSTESWWALKCPPESTGIFAKSFDAGQIEYASASDYTSMARYNKYYYQLQPWFGAYTDPAVALFSGWTTSVASNDKWYTISIPEKSMRMPGTHFFSGTNDTSVWANWGCAYNGARDRNAPPAPRLTPSITFDITPTYRGERVFSTKQAIPLIDISVKHPTNPNRKIRTTPYLTIEAQKIGNNGRPSGSPITKPTYCHNMGTKCAQEIFRTLPEGTYDIVVRWRPDAQYDNNRIFRNAVSNTIRVRVVQEFECRFNGAAETVWVKYYDLKTKSWKTTQGTAATIVRSGDPIYVSYPTIEADDYVGIVRNLPMDNPELSGKIRAITKIYGGTTGTSFGTPREPGEVRLYQLNLMELANSGPANYTFGAYEDLGTWTVTGARWTSENINDVLKVFWPSTVINPSSNKRLPFALERNIEIYGLAWIIGPNGSITPMEGWHSCGANNPRTGDMTIISSQVNQ